jgi:hypothetical protein
MIVKNMIELLKTMDTSKGIMIACDEEWNTIFKSIEIDRDENGNYILFGLSGTEIDR